MILTCSRNSTEMHRQRGQTSSKIKAEGPQRSWSWKHMEWPSSKWKAEENFTAEHGRRQYTGCSCPWQWSLSLDSGLGFTRCPQPHPASVWGQVRPGAYRLHTWSIQVLNHHPQLWVRTSNRTVSGWVPQLHTRSWPGGTAPPPTTVLSPIIHGGVFSSAGPPNQTTIYCVECLSDLISVLGRGMGSVSWSGPRGSCRWRFLKLVLSRTSLQCETHCCSCGWPCHFLQTGTPDPNKLR